MVMGLTVALASVACVLASASAQPAKDEYLDFLNKLEHRARTAASTASPSIAYIVASRSEQYPKAAGPEDVPGKLGEFKLAEFVKGADLEKLKLAKRLDLSDREGIASHAGASGVVIDPAGLVLTPYHAIAGATKLYVFLPIKDGRGVVGSYADIHAADARSDLAVLKLLHPPEGLKAISIATVRMPDSRPGHLGQPGQPPPNVEKGKLVGLMANPFTSSFALGGPNFSYGAITNIRIRLGDNNGDPSHGPAFESYYRYGQLLQFSVQPAISRNDLKLTEEEKTNDMLPGGALINLDGELIGLTTATATVYNKTVGPGYAMPMDEHVRRVIEVLRKGEEVEYGYLGIQLDTAGNLVVSKISPFSPADVAHMRMGDVITHINGVRADSYQDLLLYAGNAMAGAKLKLNVLRDREPGIVYLTLGKFRNTQPYIASVRPDAVFGLRVDHLSMLVQQASPTHHPEADPATVRGVCIREIATNSPAATRFKALGDDPYKWIISHVNGVAVTTPAEFYSAARGQTSVKLTLREFGAGGAHELKLP